MIDAKTNSQPKRNGILIAAAVLTCFLLLLMQSGVLTRHVALRSTTEAFDVSDAVNIEYLVPGVDTGDGLVQHSYDRVVCRDPELLQLIRDELRAMTPSGYPLDYRDSFGKFESISNLRKKATLISPQHDGTADDSNAIYLSPRGIIWLNSSGHAFEARAMPIFDRIHATGVIEDALKKHGKDR